MTRPLTVLYVDEAGALVSGASRRLMEAVLHLDREAVRPVVACPAGEIAEALKRSGVECFAWTAPALEKVSGHFAGVRVVDPAGLAVSLARLAPSVRRLAAIARSCGAGALHGNTFKANISAFAAARMLNVKVYWHFREMARPDSVFIRSFAPLADAVIFVSEAAQASFLKKGKAKKNMRVVHDGLDLETFHPGVAPMDLGAIGVPVGKKAIGLFGRFSEEKGHAVLLEALPSILEREPDAVAVFAGCDLPGGEAKSKFGELKKAAVGAGLSEAVFFPGYLQDVAGAMKAMDVVVAPSLEEGFGGAAMEALAVGTPVVATPVGAMAELIEDGKEGRLVPPGDAKALADAVAEALSDPKRRAAMSSAAAEKAKRFDIRNTARALEEIYAG